MRHTDWYCVQVAAGCEKKAQADLLARRVVVQDKFIENVEVLGEVLASSYEVQFATSGLEGLALVRHQRPDLILLDVMMPKKSGFEVCEILRSDAALSSIRIIIGIR